MDLTPQTLRDVEFREKLRGYHPDDVDDFLEEVAVALDAVLSRLRAAEAAAAGAPPTAGAEAPVAADPNLNEGTLSRALLLAQRTADLAISEAEDNARRINDDARADADRIVADAQARATAMTQEAKAAAEASVTELEQRRAGLEQEVASLQSWASQHRDRLREVLSDQLRALDIWLTTSAVAPPSTRVGTPGPTRLPGPGPGEPTAPVAVDQPSDADTGGSTADPAAPADIAGPAVAPAEAAGATLTAGALGDDSAPAGAVSAEGELAAVAVGAAPAAPPPTGSAAGQGTATAAGGAPSFGPAPAATSGGSAWRPGGGDGVGLFDQDGDTLADGGDDAAHMAGRFFRRR